MFSKIDFRWSTYPPRRDFPFFSALTRLIFFFFVVHTHTHFHLSHQKPTHKRLTFVKSPAISTALIPGSASASSQMWWFIRLKSTSFAFSAILSRTRIPFVFGFAISLATICFSGRNSLYTQHLRRTISPYLSECVWVGDRLSSLAPSTLLLSGGYLLFVIQRELIFSNENSRWWT